jgi:hypothetical protein
MKIKIPDCIKLTGNQRQRVIDWAEKIQEPKNEEPDCCDTSVFNWAIVTSGIGDSITVEGMGQKLFVNEDEF